MPAERDELENILNAGLDSYPDAEPLAGIDSRILARIRTARVAEKARATHLIFALSLAALAIIGCAVFFIRFGSETQPSAVSSAQRSAISILPPEAELSSTNTRLVKAQAIKVHRQSARRAVPLMSTATEQEHLLLLLLSQTPVEAPREPSDEPNEIAPLKITPLEIALVDVAPLPGAEP